MPEDSTQAVIDQLASTFDHLDEFAPPVSVDDLDNWPGHSRRPSQDNSKAVNYRHRRQLVGVAAACIAVAGAAGVWWATVRDDNPATLVPVDEPDRTNDTIAESTDPNASVEPEATGPSSPDEDGSPPRSESVVGRIATLDPWSAAQLFQVDAQYQASPAQAADLTIANELRSRDCYQQQGVDIAAFDPDRLTEREQYEQDRWDRRRRLWTPEGQQELRQGGNSLVRDRFADEPVAYPHATTPAPEQCYPAATGVTYLGGTVGWSEEQLSSALMDGDRKWAPVTWAFGRLPGTESAKAASDDCMIARGWDQWTQPGAYQSLYTEPEVSDNEINQMNDFIDCNQQVDASAVYLNASANYVNEFRAEFADQLDQIANERADTLTEAYSILRAAGIDPLSD